MRLPRLSASIERRSITLAARVAGSQGASIGPMELGDCVSRKSCQSNSDCAGFGVCTVCNATSKICDTHAF